MSTNSVSSSYKGLSSLEDDNIIDNYPNLKLKNTSISSDSWEQVNQLDEKNYFLPPNSKKKIAHKKTLTISARSWYIHF